MSEILIEGRGIAAHNLAYRLAEGGANILLSGPEYTNPRSWFVVTDHLPIDIQRMIRGRYINSHTLESCRFITIDEKENITEDFVTPTNNLLEPYACVMVDHEQMKTFYRERAISHPSVSIIDTSVKKISEGATGYHVLFKNGEKQSTEKVIDASGTASHLLRSLSSDPLKDDAIVYWIYGHRVKGKFDSNTMIFPLKGRDTGRIPWVVPWSKDTADIIAADYCRVSEWKELIKNGTCKRIYENFRDMCMRIGVCSVDNEYEKITGRIRMVPTNRAYGTRGVFSVGDAAGQACPNMAEAIAPALQNSDYLASKLNSDPYYTGEEYYYDWRYGVQKIAPYELSTSYLVDRLSHDRAGTNVPLYKAISETRDIKRMTRLMRERKPNVTDIPSLINVGIHHPALLVKTAKTLLRSHVVYRLPKYKELLYGKK